VRTMRAKGMQQQHDRDVSTTGGATGGATGRGAEDLERVWLMVEGLDGLDGVGGGTSGAGDDDVSDGPIGTAPMGGAAACAWCGDAPAGAGYFVAAREERFSACPEYWGRAPEYLDLRRDG